MSRGHAPANHDEPAPEPVHEEPTTEPAPAPLTLEERVAKLEALIPRIQALIGGP